MTAPQTTRLFDFLNALLTGCQALQDGPLAGRVVFDGPMPFGHTVPEALIVGGEWVPSTQGRTAVTASQEPSPLGNYSNDELIAVSCAAVSQSGDVEMGDRRAAAEVTMAAVAALLLTDQGLRDDYHAIIRSVDSVQQFQNERGAACAVNFTVSAQVLLWNG